MNLGVHFTWSRNHRVLLNTYSWGKTPLEMLVESWLTSSVEDRKSALISRWYVLHEAFLQLLCWNWCSSRLEVGVSGNLWNFLKDVKPLVVYYVECMMPLEPKHGKCISSWVDLRYTNQFCISVVTSVFFSSCDSVLGDSLVFHQVNRGSLWFDWEHGIPLYAMQGNRASSCGEGEVSWVVSSYRRHLGYILDLRQGWPFENLVCSAKSGHLSSYDGYLRNLN